MRRRVLPGKIVAVVLGLLGVAGAIATVWHFVQPGRAESMLFRHVVIDAEGPEDPWGKGVGDIDGDGLPDIVIGGHSSGELVWYRNPKWVKATIAEGEPFGTDIEIVDMNGDGRRDVVSVTGAELKWFRNPDWAPTVIATRKLHDIEVVDLDGDGDSDVVARNQGAFGGSGATIYLYQQLDVDDWQEVVLDAPEGEGLKVADINSDGRPDVIVNGVWFENVQAWQRAGWRPHKYADSWTWPHAFVDVGDISGDGRPDIVLSPAEPAGERYRLSWFEAPRESQEWMEHVIATEVETVMHFVGLEDMDSDGDMDVVTAQMHQGADPDMVTVYYNGGEDHWLPEVIARTGSHSMRLADLDRDGDVDIFGANWSGDYQVVEMWENQTCPAASPWRRHVVDDDRPSKAVFVDSVDLNKDGFEDIVAGAWWYRNPGLLSRIWQRERIGPDVNQMAVLVDLNDDKFVDVVATAGGSGINSGELVWARNDGSGKFVISAPVAKTNGDFLQGAAVGSFDGTGATQIALSWHASGRGVQLLTAPSGGEGRWAFETISAMSQDEGLSAGDIDGDGDTDLLLGTKWLRNDGMAWSVRALTSDDRKPDRNVLADINDDGLLDAVVGFEAISVPGDLVWFEQAKERNAEWRRHDVSTITGPMSLDVADIDRDGDLDVIAGEHNLEHPSEASIFWFANVDGRGGKWNQNLIYRGDEHHDGAHAADLDNDGDMDIVSIGWSHPRVVVYENRVGACNPSD